MIGKGLESSRSSEMQLGSLTKASFGAVSGVVADVTHRAVLAHVAPTVADQPVGNAGGATLSKFSEHGVIATHGPVPVGQLDSRVKETFKPFDRLAVLHEKLVKSVAPPLPVPFCIPTVALLPFVLVALPVTLPKMKSI